MCKLKSTGCRLYFYLFTLCCLFSGFPFGQAKADEGPISISSHLKLIYDWRYLSDIKIDGQKQDDEFDHKLHQIGDINIKENEWGHLRFSISGDMIEDIDNRENNQTDRIRTVHDTWSSSYHGYLYLCQVEIYKLGALSYARLGRQYIDHELTSHIDGLNLLLDFDISGMQMKPFAYCGIPVHLYDFVKYGDTIEAGGGAHILLGKSTKITLEHQYIEEIPEFYGTFGAEGERIYNQSAAALRQSLFDNGYGYISFVMIDNSPKQANAMFSFLFDTIELEIDVSYFYQFSRVSDFSVTASPYTNLTGTIKPYHNITLDIMKCVYKDYIFISGGSECRLLDYDEEETEFNHSYNHEYLAVIFDKLPIIGKKGFNFSIQADFWKVMDNNDRDSILSFGGELGYKKSQLIDITVGSYYSLYRYDYFLNLDEKTRVYTYYSNFRYYILEELYLDASYELETSDIYEHQLKAAIGHML